MLDTEKRKQKIITYVKKNPLCTFTDIRKNHTNHEYNTVYLRKLLEELLADDIGQFMDRYFTYPKSDDEIIKLFINIVKTAPLTKPAFSSLSFKLFKVGLDNFERYDLAITDCICLFNMKLKLTILLNAQNRESKSIFSIRKHVRNNIIKLINSYSFKTSYDFLVIRNNFEHTWSSLENIIQFFTFYHTYANEYYFYKKNNHLPIKDLIKRLSSLTNIQRQKFPSSRITSYEDFDKKQNKIDLMDCSESVKQNMKSVAFFELYGVFIEFKKDHIKIIGRNGQGNPIPKPKPPIVNYDITKSSDELGISNKAFRKTLVNIVDFDFKNPKINKTVNFWESQPNHFLFLDQIIQLVFDDKSLNYQKKKIRELEKIWNIPITKDFI